MKMKVLLFQESLRKHILNFGIGLRSFEFVHRPKRPASRPMNLKDMPTEMIFKIRKTNLVTRIRQLVGIPNIRIIFAKEDVIFTYGCLLVTNRPYCVYIENALALFNYNNGIAKNPLARFLVTFFLKRQDCKKVLFMSEAAHTGFFSTMRFSKNDRARISGKSAVCYPLIRHPFRDVVAPKRIAAGDTVRFLFTGTFYIKGGLEIIHAFDRIRKEFRNVELTIITGTEAMWPEDKELIESIPDAHLYDAAFDEKTLYERFYDTHHVFLYPTYRDSFGLVLVEALAAGLPIIGTDQYATGEMIIDDFNGYLMPDHPLKDYDPETFEIHGAYAEPADFFDRLFELQRNDSLKDIEEFLYRSMKTIVLDPSLIPLFSNNSLTLYKEKFESGKISRLIESVFQEATKR
jgi:glycosyltransferase involved in cell wall biosynthesis